MDHKKTIFFIITCVALVLLLAVGITAFVGSEQQNKKKSIVEETDAKLLALAQSDIGLDELTVYDFNRFSSCISPRDLSENKTPLPFSECLFTLHSFNMYFPVQMIRQVDDTRVVVVYHLNMDGTDVYAYVVFEKGTSSGFSTETFNFCGEYYYVTEDVPSYQTFSSLEVGMPVPFEVKDALLSLDISLLSCFSVNENGECLKKDVYLLKEGVLYIEWNCGVVSAKTNEYAVESRIETMEFYEYGTVCEDAPVSSVFLSGYVPELP